MAPVSAVAASDAPKAKRKRGPLVRKPVEVIATFHLVDSAGNPVDAPAGSRLVTDIVTRDIADFARKAMLGQAAGLFAFIGVPAGEKRKPTE